MAKIGIFGGCFNPIHLGHITFANQIKRIFKLNSIIIVPTQNPQYKSVNLAPFKHRVKMCVLAVKNLSDFSVSTIEKEDSNSPSHTIETLLKLKQQHPNDELFFIVGPDMFTTLKTWHEIESILKIAKIITAAENGSEFKHFSNIKKELNSPNILITQLKMSAVHSTFIRVRLAQKISCKQFLNSAVNAYILKNEIYSQKQQLLIEATNASKNLLSPTRFRHCELVSKAACELANEYGENQFDALIAGVLHDVLKEKDSSYLLNLMHNFKIHLNEIERLSPKLWHGFAGAAYCEKVLGFKNKQILNAIRFHTIAKKDMTKFEKIIYIADCISEDRKYRDAEIKRQLAHTSLDEAMLYQLKTTLSFMCRKENLIHPATFDCYTQLILNKLNF